MNQTNKQNYQIFREKKSKIKNTKTSLMFIIYKPMVGGLESHQTNGQKYKQAIR